MALTAPGAGSDYAMAYRDATKQAFDGSKTYKLHMPPNVPVNDFWAVTLYDTQTRSMLQTGQNFRLSEARPRGSRRTRTGRATSISLRSPLEGKRATGSRQFRVRAGSRSCGCTGRWSHGSTKLGGPARLGW